MNAFFNLMGRKHLVLQLQGHSNKYILENEYRFMWWCNFHVFRIFFDYNDGDDDEKHVDIMIEVHKFESIFQQIQGTLP